MVWPDDITLMLTVLSDVFIVVVLSLPSSLLEEAESIVPIIIHAFLLLFLLFLLCGQIVQFVRALLQSRLRTLFLWCMLIIYFAVIACPGIFSLKIGTAAVRLFMSEPAIQMALICAGWFVLHFFLAFISAVLASLLGSGRLGDELSDLLAYLAGGY